MSIRSITTDIAGQPHGPWGPALRTGSPLLELPQNQHACRVVIPVLESDAPLFDLGSELIGH